MADTANQAQISRGDPERKGYAFGTFKGVFTPSILTILGVIMYLRFGWVLGHLGLGLTLLTVTLATTVTFITALSLTALATNMRIGAGGAYFIISRSLGVEAGAAIGVPLFFAQALGVAFYLSGFAEAVTGVWPWLSPKMVAVVTLIILTVTTYYSADIALRIQYGILLVIAASLIAFFIGTSQPIAPFETAALSPERLSFWVVFAVFFPAVTGIEAGIAMSGDLKTPGRSLAIGTLGAVLVGYVIYIAIPIVMALRVDDPEHLIANPLIMQSLARGRWLIIAGVIAASISSAAGSLLGAPRTLQALARDGVVPRFIGRGYGETNDPRIASLVAFLVALAAILAGDLNIIAPVLTMFFLTSYGLLNASAGLESLIGSPAWRPKLRTPAMLPVFGAVICFGFMFMINAGATFVAAAISVLIFFLVRKKHLNVGWADLRAGILMLMVRFAINHLARRAPGERTWRPNLLVLSGAPTSRLHLIELGDALAQDPSALTVATIVGTKSWSAERIKSAEQTIRQYLHKQGIGAMVKVLPADDVVSGVEAMVQAYGFGPIVPNTILMGDSQRVENFQRLASLIQLIHRLRRNLVLLRESSSNAAIEGPEPIDVWLRGGTPNAALMITMGAVLKRHPDWRRSSLVLKTIVDTPEEVPEGHKRLDEIIVSHRVKAASEVLVKDADDVYAQIRRSSANAGVVFMGIRPPEPEESIEAYSTYYESLIQATEGFPETALVLASEDIKFSDVMGMEA